MPKPTIAITIGHARYSRIMTDAAYRETEWYSWILHQV